MENTIFTGSTPNLAERSDAVLNIIRKRRTIRHFSAEDVSQEQIETLLEMAMCAPNRLDRRPWHFVVIRDKALQKQLADHLRVHPYLEVAPVVIAVCGLPEVSRTWLMDVSAATENMVLAATALGLGATWVGNPGEATWDSCEKILLKALAIPYGEPGVMQKLLRKWNRLVFGKTTSLPLHDHPIRIPALVAVGHPAEEPPPHGKHDRFDETRIHYGSW
jgi:nitroreductase